MSEDDKASIIGQQLLECGKAKQNFAVGQAELHRIGTALENIGRKLKGPMPSDGAMLTNEDHIILVDLQKLGNLIHDVAVNQQTVAKCDQLMRDLHLIS